MNTFTKSFHSKGCLYSSLLLLTLTLWARPGFAQYGTIDIGINEASSPANTIEVKIRPTFTINGSQTISGILYTVRWTDATISLSTNYIYPYFVAPQGSPVLSNGYYHQVFAATPMNPVGTTITPGTEVLISSFSFTGGSCASFEIANDDYTAAHNGNVYLELGGTKVTGLIYRPIANLSSVGGIVSGGGGSITLGQNTGTFSLSAYSGTILGWQKQLNAGTWNDISGTSGLTTYSEVPSSVGIWAYRAKVQRGSCPVDYSLAAAVTVTWSSSWTGNVNKDWLTAGNWTNGVPNQYLDAIIPNVSPNPFPMVAGSGTCLNLTINTDAFLTLNTNGNLTVKGTLSNNNGSNGFLILSDATGTGSLLHNTASVPGIIERYISGSSNLTAMMYHLISVPLTDGGFSIQVLGSYLYDFDEPSNQWIGLGVSTTTPMDNHRGYMIYYPGPDVMYKFTGNMNNGPFTALTSYTAGKGYNLVPNPYPSAIDWSSGSWVKTNVDGATYIWPAGASALSSNYASFAGGVGTNGGNRYIPMGQSFFVHASGAPVLTMDNSVRLHNAQPFWKSNEVIPDLLRIQASANGASDETIVRFSDSASLNFDSDRDAYKLSGGENAPSLCSVTPDETELSINALPYNSQDVIVPLNFSLNANAQVSFTASGMESFTSGTPIYLEDLLLNKVIDLRNNPVYSFSNAIGNNQSRFRLRFMGITATLEQPESGRGKVFVSQGKIYLDLPDMQQNEARVDLSDVLGRSLGSRSVRLDGILSLPAPPMEGVCIVRVTSGNKTFSSRLLIP